jgi:hypothetical protein
MQTILFKYAQQKEIEYEIHKFKEELTQKSRDPLSKFDWFRYLQKHPELYSSGIQSKLGLYQHWIQQGKPKGYVLLGENQFVWEYYLALYPDLGRHGLVNEQDAIKHWIMHGHKENRSHSIPEFDWKVYVFYNSLYQYGVTTKQSALRYWYANRVHTPMTHSLEPFKIDYERMLQGNPPQTIAERSDHDSLSNHDDLPHLDELSMYRIKTPGQVVFRDFLTGLSKKEFIEMGTSKGFILVVDFPCYGGGCSFFLNSILSKYKKKCNCLVLRTFDDVISWTLNDDYIVHVSRSEKDAVHYLQSMSSKITKVFINSVIGHSSTFLDAICCLEKEITAITHDYSLLFGQQQYSQIYYHKACDVKISEPKYFSKIDRIVTQNMQNMDLYQSLSAKAATVITSLPDYTKSGTMVCLDNPAEKIVIGVLGSISDVKGYYLLAKLVDLVEAYSDHLDLVIFGSCKNAWPKQYMYKNVRELNRLLEQHRPQLWVEISLWPETYSYTLSLAMATQLPILYQKKYFPSTVVSRLSQYTKSYEFDHIRAVSLKYLEAISQPFFYTIEPTIYYPPFWETYFGPANILREEMCTEKIQKV